MQLFPNYCEAEYFWTFGERTWNLSLQIRYGQTHNLMYSVRVYYIIEEMWNILSVQFGSADNGDFPSWKRPTIAYWEA
jgi:hypothetical protein